MPEAVRVMISCGEASGDMHGAALVREAERAGLNMAFFGLGGDLMAEAGVDLRHHIRETAVMGLTEVIGSLGRVLKVRRSLAAMVARERPRALVLIDSPDLNQALAKAAHRAGVPVVYYICPSVWAWRKGRLKWLRRLVDRRAVILPFEKEFYAREGLSADLVGHPLLDELPLDLTKDEARAGLGLSPGARALAVLPGSRRAVAGRLAGPMLDAVDLLLVDLPDLVPIIPRPGTLPADFLDGLIASASPRVRDRLRVTEGRSHEVLKAADAALLASGTSTVEGAIFGTPMVATYKVSALSWLLAKFLVKVPYVSVANLIAGREIVPELLQDRCRPEELARELKDVLTSEERRRTMTADLSRAAALLGGPGASAKVLAVLMEEIARHAAPLAYQADEAETVPCPASPAGGAETK